jgi:hypothetical protein
MNIGFTEYQYSRYLQQSIHDYILGADTQKVLIVVMPYTKSF